MTITGGRWVTTGGVQRWVKAPKARRLPSTPTTPLAALIACPTCRARIDQQCTTSGGFVRIPHKSRLVSRRCPCGAIPKGRARYCETCRVERRRETWREYARDRYRPARKEMAA